jgi:hypothetical protein
LVGRDQFSTWSSWSIGTKQHPPRGFAGFPFVCGPCVFFPPANPVVSFEVVGLVVGESPPFDSVTGCEDAEPDTAGLARGHVSGLLIITISCLATA